MSLELEELARRLENKGFPLGAKDVRNLNVRSTAKGHLPPDLKRHPKEPDPEWWRQVRFTTSTEAKYLEKARGRGPYVSIEAIDRTLRQPILDTRSRRYLERAKDHVGHDTADQHTIFHLGLNPRTIETLQRNLRYSTPTLTIEQLLSLSDDQILYCRKIGSIKFAEIKTRLTQYQDRLKTTTP